MSAIGRKQPVVLPKFSYLERPLSVKADIRLPSKN